MNKALIGFEWRKNERIRIRGRGREKTKLQVVRGKKGNGRLETGAKRFHSLFEIINAIEQGEFPEPAMLTFHPQRWTDNPASWAKELVWQGVKNGVKKRIVKSRK